MNREDLISGLDHNGDSPFDIIIIGGGATGTGIALDAVTRGYKTILFEQADFSAGTSSRSTKLVHGGVRYLAQGDLLLVTEALRERGLLLKNAPGLTGNQEFVIPAYSVFDVLLYTAGLKFYDLLAGSLSLGRSYFIGKSEVLRRIPTLKADGLRGGIVYHDGQFDDSRLLISMARLAAGKGAVVLNYFEVSALIKNADGRISGVKVRDRLSGKVREIKARLVINSAGVFADAVHRLDDPLAQPTIRPSQGVHIVIDRSYLQGNTALMIPKTDDGRVLFAIPWYDKVVVGTTDTPLEKIDNEPRALESEIEFILNTAGRYLTKPPVRKDARSIFAGLRPLAAAGGSKGSTKEVSRRHKISLSPSGLLTVIGGKWTTYRCMAEETLDKAVSESILEKKPCVTKNLEIIPFNNELREERLKIYGNGAPEIEKMIETDEGTGRLIHKDLPYTQAELIWIIRNEMPCTIADILSRRTRALILDARASLEAAPVVAALMAELRGKDQAWIDDQIRAYSLLTENYI